VNNETVQLHAIITDVAQNRFRYLENRDRVDPLTFGCLVAQDVIQRLDSADILVVSRWTRRQT
jgi:hypothetical protein